MTTTLLTDILALEAAHDEELPGYQEATRAATAPAYDSSAYDEPLMTYRLRQYNRKIQMLAAHDAPGASSYRITTNSSFRIFSKKPELEVLHTSPAMCQRNMASISFDSDGGFPWRPRAHFDYTADDGLSSRYHMESLNFEDWTVGIGDKTYVWTLEMRPIALILCEKNSDAVIARFTFSDKGVLALRGAEVGEMDIYRDSLTLARDGIERVVCGVMVVITFLKKMGRNYTNPRLNGLARVGSQTGETMLPSLHRGSTAGYSSLGNWAG